MRRIHSRFGWLLLMVAPLPGAAAQDDGVRLPDVVITASRSPQDIRDVPAAIEVISGETLRRSNASRLDQVLQNVAGIDLQGGAFPGAPVKMNLRGLTTGYQSERVLVLVDGRRINDPYQGNTELALLPLDNVERIEILRGPASALYGSNAEGGVINIITRQGRAQPSTRLSLAGGSHDTLRATIAHGWAKGSLDYFLAGGALETDGYTKNSDGTDRDWSARNFSGNFGWAVNAFSEIRLRLGGYSGEGTDENSRREVWRDYQDVMYSVHHEREDEFLARVYRNGADDTYDWKRAGRATYRLSTIGGTVQHTRRVHPRHHVTLGLEVREDLADIREVLNRIDEDATTLSIYAQDLVRAAEALQITLGLRHDYSEDYPNMLSPRIGALWRLAESVSVFGSVNRAHRAPSLADRFVKTEFNGMLFEGNPELDPETLTAYEVGVRWAPAGPTRGTAAVFYNDLRDVFEFMLDSDGVYRNYNVAREETFGVEFGLEFDFTTNLSAFLNYTWTDGSYKEFPPDPAVEGNRLAYLAKNKLSGGIQFVTERGFVARLEGRYTGSREGDAHNTPANRLDEHLVFDARLRQPLSRRLTASLSVENLGNTRYQDFPHQDQPGRTVMVGLEAEW